MRGLRRLLSCCLVAACSHGAYASGDAPAPVQDYLPRVGGVIRARWEMETDGGLNRFELRNARVSLTGRIAAPVDYFLQADLCDQGKFKFLDGWVRVTPFAGLKFQAGQFRMPFGVDSFRGPANYLFANRSFIGKYVCNVRAVGLKASYTIPCCPVTVEGGVFNPTTISDHTRWTHQKSYAAKLTLIAGDFRFATGVQSLIPDSVRVNLADGAVTYTCGRWLAEAEYMYKHYTGSAHKPCHAVNAFVNYTVPVNAGMFNRLSFQGRFDMQTDHSSGVRDDSGRLYTTDPSRRRVTIGATIGHLKRDRWLDVRVNYEKYFYNSGVTAPAGAADKVVAEIVLKF